jgi:hypothetical protein
VKIVGDVKESLRIATESGEHEIILKILKKI